MNPIPIRLKNEPLIEAIWQVQFDSPGAGDALPGLLYASLRKQYSEVRLQRLPAASIPAIVADTEPSLQLAAKVRLDTPQAAFIWQIGDRVATVNCRKPYAGWTRFKECILDLIQTMEESGLVPSPQRHSLRYIDLLALDEAPDLSALQLTMQIGAHKVKRLPLQLRVELPDGEFVHIVQIATPAQAQLPEGIQQGSIVDLETLSREHAATWGQVRDQLDMLHDRSKRLFFEHLLTAQATQLLEPEL
jgi:uncharacterized protein (TIGR04255 family)